MTGPDKKMHEMQGKGLAGMGMLSRMTKMNLAQSVVALPPSGKFFAQFVMRTAN